MSATTDMRLNNLGTIVTSLLVGGAIWLASGQEIKAQGDTSYGSMKENDGVPIPGISNTNELNWSVIVSNASNSKIIQIAVSNYWTLSTNILISPGNWTITSAQNNGNNLWNVVMVANNSLGYINANGGTKTFDLKTTYDSTNSVILYGQRDGAVKFESGPSFYMPDVSQLIGPTGVAWPVYSSAGSHGSVTPNGQVNVADGTSTNFLANADNGYRLSTILTNGTLAWTNSAGDNQITSTNLSYGPVTNASSVSFSFELKRFTLTVLSAYGNPIPGTTNNVPFNTPVVQSIEMYVTNSPGRRVRNIGATVVQWGLKMKFSRGLLGLIAGLSLAASAKAGQSLTNIVLTVTNNITVTWNWQAEYHVTAGCSSGNGSVLKTDDWIAAGANYTNAAVPNQYCFLTDGKVHSQDMKRTIQ